ncbi:MAG: FIST C-terminal domain-containing protein [Chloroflexi bacterium]|nr:FIST C-terminal domain-containing protein [Chloroflexota bacterium]
MSVEMQFASAATTERELDRAVRALADEIRGQIDSPAFDFVMAFFSEDYSAVAPSAADRIHTALNPRVLVGCTCEGVIAKNQEIEKRMAITLVAAQLPDVELVPFSLDADDWEALQDPHRLQGLVHAASGTRLFVMVADPFSTPMDQVLDAFNTHYEGVPIIGGMASGAGVPGSNVLLLNDRAFATGSVGVAFAGKFVTDIVVSQGCRPFGRTFSVTEANDNIILSLDGEPPLRHIQNLAAQLSDEDQALLRNGLFVGRAIDTGRAVMGRGDFLVRSVIGVDRESGAIGVGDYIHAGETIQFHLRDQRTAQEDLELLLTPQALDAPPSGALLFSCNGRGTRLYDHPNGDISTIQGILGGINLAGFFAAGEIGPIGGKNFLHGHTASMALFRPGLPLATD